MMKTTLIRTLSFACCVAAMACFARADITITDGTSAPTYSTTLNFDEAGGPTGAVGAGDFASYGITSLDAGDGAPQVGDFTDPGVGGPWIGSGNSFFGNFGVFIQFDGDLTDFSADIWDPAGPPSPFGGGAGVFVWNDGVEVTNYFYEPAWGGLGNQAVNISATNGMVFDEVRILGFGFPATTFADNLSWNVVPEPSTGLMATFASLLLLTMRRK